ncbi:MAG: protein kinase, partial [Proteobacteria bacterium]|nr:protein kinase [Pseudomonadota bacterium]
MEAGVTSVGAPRPLPAEEGGLASPLSVGAYECREILGSSIIGITYAGWDQARAAQVVIKEFLPAAFAVRQPDGSVAPRGHSSEQSFADALRQFLGAADALAEVRHQNIVRVRSVTESNGTGYVVMDHVAGETLDAVLRASRTLGKPQLDAMLPPLLDGLEALHSAELLHLELRPDKIVLGADGAPVILAYGATRQGFTAARQILSDRSKGRRLLHSPSLYAPVELYSADAKWGQWTDIYSLGAVLYECVSGEPPPTAPGRLIDDSMVPLEDLEATDFDPATLSGIQAALDTRPADRPQQVAAWRRLFTGGSGPEGVNAPLARTSARGAAVLTRDTAKVGASPARRVRWAVPVLALAAAGSLITYLDTSV